MEIITAAESQFADVRRFYHSLIDDMREAHMNITWIKDVYPSPDFLRESIRRREVYIGCQSGDIAAAMVLNHQYNEGYRDFPWRTEAKDTEIMVIHALGVHPRCGGKGCGREMVAKAISTAKGAGMKAIRLDVLSGNLPAKRLYTGCGFQYMQTVQMFYENTGTADFELYEYVL